MVYLSFDYLQNQSKTHPNRNMYQSRPSLESLLLQKSCSPNQVASSYSPIIIFVKNFQYALNNYLQQSMLQGCNQNVNLGKKIVEQKKNLILQLINVLRGLADEKHWTQDGKLEDSMRVLIVINSLHNRNQKTQKKLSILYKTKVVQNKLRQLIFVKQRIQSTKISTEQFEQIKKQIQKCCVQLRRQLQKITELVIYNQENKENCINTIQNEKDGKKSSYEKLLEISSIKKGINFQNQHECQVRLQIDDNNKCRKWVDTGFSEGKQRCFSKGQISQLQSKKQIQCQNKVGHYKRQILQFSNHLQPSVFTSINPQIHRLYQSQISSSYSEVSPFKLTLPVHKQKPTITDMLTSPKINGVNYFSEGIPQQKLALHYCKPGTKQLYTYFLSDIEGMDTVTKQFQNIEELKIDWVFGNYVKTVVTSTGEVYGINCRTTESKMDPSLYQISTKKVSNRGKLPKPLRDSSFICCNNFLYIIGGYNLAEKNCSSNCYKYSLKTYKWVPISSSHFATRNPTVCTYQNRYIIKIGGLNQFNFLNKEIEIYDTLNDRWSTVHTLLKYANQQVPILQDSTAVQINQKQILIFGGKNSNGFGIDNSAILEIKEIREKIKADSKVSAEIYGADTERRQFISFAGTFTQFNPIIHNNCIYSLRSSFCSIPPKRQLQYIQDK